MVHSFYFWEGWIYLTLSNVKFWMMIFQWIVWGKSLFSCIVFHITVQWSSKNYDSVPHSQGLLNKVSEHFCHTLRNQEQIILVSVIKALKPYDKIVSLHIVYHMYIGSQWDMTVDFTLSLWQSWLNLWSLIFCIFFCTTVYFLIIVLDSETRH